MLLHSDILYKNSLHKGIRVVAVLYDLCLPWRFCAIINFMNSINFRQSRTFSRPGHVLRIYISISICDDVDVNYPPILVTVWPYLLQRRHKLIWGRDESHETPSHIILCFSLSLHGEAAPMIKISTNLPTTEVTAPPCTGIVTLVQDKLCNAPVNGMLHYPYMGLILCFAGQLSRN